MDIFYVSSENYFDVLEQNERILFIFIQAKNFEKTKDYQKVLDFCKIKAYSLGIIELEESEDLFTYFNIKKDKTILMFENKESMIRSDFETFF